MRARRLAPVVMSGLALAAACTNGQQAAGSPAASPSSSASSRASTTASSSTASSDERAAAAAADAFDRTADAMAGGDPVDTRKLERYATRAVALAQAKDLAELKSSNLEARGSSRTSLLAVAVHGSTATVKRCIDGSKVVLHERGATKPLGDGRGLPAATSTVTMVEQTGRWLVSERASKDGSRCVVRHP